MVGRDFLQSRIDLREIKAFECLEGHDMASVRAHENSSVWKSELTAFGVPPRDRPETREVGTDFQNQKIVEESVSESQQIRDYYELLRAQIKS